MELLFYYIKCLTLSVDLPNIKPCSDNYKHKKNRTWVEPFSCDTSFTHAAIDIYLYGFIDYAANQNTRERIIADLRSYVYDDREIS